MGRSGSTLLDMLIATNDKVFSLGEFQRYNREWEKTDSVCSCGEALTTCPFWGRFGAGMENFNIINRVNIRDYSKVILFLLNPFRRKLHFSRLSENDRMLSTLWPELKAKGYEYLLDSSKDVGRLIELNQNAHVELYNIHIVRDGRSVARSFHEKGQGAGKNYFLSLFKWIVANALIQAYIRKSHLKTLHISYETLCQHPEEAFKRIKAFTGIKIPHDYVAKIRTAKDYHNIGGNRIRRKANREKFEGVIYASNRKVLSNPAMHFISTLIVWPFNKWWNI